MPAGLDEAARRLALSALRSEILGSEDYTSESLHTVRRQLLEQAEASPGSPKAIVARRAAAFCDFILGGEPLPDFAPLRSVRGSDG